MYICICVYYIYTYIFLICMYIYIYIYAYLILYTNNKTTNPTKKRAKIATVMILYFAFFISQWDFLELCPAKLSISHLLISKYSCAIAIDST